MKINYKYTHIPSLLRPPPKPICYLARSSQSTELRSLHSIAAYPPEFNNLVLVYYLKNNGHATEKPLANCQGSRAESAPPASPGLW